MKEMNLAAVLIAKRRERKITQDELAAHVKVSKASVSKWENGNSYPDITHLPIIASYFDISIDQLMNYSPQLSETEIKKIYTKLSEDFATEPFEDVISKCDAIAKKHYSCYPFVLYVALLYINHASMADNDIRKNEIFQSAIALCEHTLRNCRDVSLLRDAAQYQAICYLSVGDAENVLRLLGDDNHYPEQHGDGWIVSQAHQILGNMEKANEVEQVELIKSLTQTVSSLISYAKLNLANYEVAKVAYERAEAIADIFNIRLLNSNLVANLYVLGALVYQTAGESERAVEVLEKYVDICIHGFFPFAIRGDAFFDRIDKWIVKKTENTPLPRNETVVKVSMLNDVLLDPVFDNLHERQDFKNLVQKLRNFIGGGI